MRSQWFQKYDFDPSKLFGPSIYERQFRSTPRRPNKTSNNAFEPRKVAYRPATFSNSLSSPPSSPSISSSSGSESSSASSLQTSRASSPPSSATSDSDEFTEDFAGFLERPFCPPVTYGGSDSYVEDPNQGPRFWSRSYRHQSINRRYTESDAHKSISEADWTALRERLQKGLCDYYIWYYPYEIAHIIWTI